mgnify:CR=1 FL=1
MSLSAEVWVAIRADRPIGLLPGGAFVLPRAHAYIAAWSPGHLWMFCYGVN